MSHVKNATDILYCRAELNVFMLEEKEILEITMFKCLDDFVKTN